MKLIEEIGNRVLNDLILWAATKGAPIIESRGTQSLRSCTWWFHAVFSGKTYLKKVVSTKLRKRFRRNSITLLHFTQL